MRRIGAVIFGLQLLGLLVWSAVLYHRYSLTVDFAGGEQGWFLMAHGNLDPLIGAWGNTPFLRNHAEVIVLALAPLYWIWHSGVTLLWVQDLAAIVTGWVAFNWIVEIARGTSVRRNAPSEQMDRRGWRHPPEPAVLALLGLALLVINPWVLWATSFDFHVQTIATCFAISAAYDLAHARKRRALLWIILCLCCGDVAATFVFGVGLSAVLAGKSTRRDGTLMMAAAFAMVAAITAVGANLGSSLSAYVPSSIVGRSAARTAQESGTQTLFTVLRAMATRPQSYLAILWGNALNIYANVSPVGLIGMASAWGFGVPLVVLLSNGLQAGARTSLYAFQNFPIYAFVTLGTVTVMTGLAHRRPRVVWTLGVVLLVNAIAWSVIWAPKAKTQWLTVPAVTATALGSVSPRIPPDDEVVASQGITGPLPDRGAFFQLGNEPVPVQRRHLWFIVTPDEGIEIEPSSLAEAQLGYLVGKLRGRVVTDRSGVYAVEVTPPPGLQTIQVPTRCSVLPAWALPSNAGRPVTSGPVSDWGMAGTGQSGYLVHGGYRRLPRGSYTAAVALRSAGPLTLEVWDADRSLLLARREIPPTGGTSTIDLAFNAPGQMPRPTTAGAAIWRTSPLPAPPNDQIEIRVYTPGSRATVFSTRLTKTPTNGTTPTGYSGC